MSELFKTRIGRYVLSLRARLLLFIYLLLYIPMCFVANFVLAMYTQYYVRIRLDRQLPSLATAFPMHIKQFLTVSNSVVWVVVFLLALLVAIWRGRRLVTRLERPFFGRWMKKEAAKGKDLMSIYRDYRDGDRVQYLDIAGNNVTGTVRYGEYKHQSGGTISAHNGFYIKNMAVSTINGSYLLYKDLVAKAGTNRSEWACVHERRNIVSVGEYTLHQS